MYNTEILAISGACAVGMLSALYFLVWRAMRFKWAAYCCAYFLLNFVFVLFDAYLQPIQGRPNPIATLIAQLANLLMVLGMNEFTGLPRRLARWFSGVAWVTAVGTTSLVALQLVPRIFAFSALAVMSTVLALQAWFALRQAADAGMRLVFLSLCVYPTALVGTLLGLVPLQMLRYVGTIPMTLIGMAILTTGLMRAQRRSDAAERELRSLNATLERRVEQRTADLQDAVKRLDHTNGELTALNASRTRLMAAACHDLRQPTHALGLLAEVACEVVPATARQPIEGIRQCSQALCNMLDMLLDMTQLEADRYRLARRTFALDELLQELRVQFQPLARHKGLSLEIATCGWAVHSDRHLLQRIVMNLVSNGIKYTVSGGVRVDVDQVGQELEIRVVDSGPGIPPDKIDAVFTDYVRLDESARTDGLGIGLPIVKRAAALLGHELVLDSVVGQGTTVRLRVPLAEAVAEVADTAPQVEGRGRVIGVVENDENILTAVTQLLTGHGFVVAPGKDWAGLQQALQRVGHEAPDLLISDMHLDAGQDGLQLIGDLVSRAAWARTAFVLVTGDLDDRIAASASALGAVTAYKPVQPRRLLRLLDQLLGSRAGGALSGGAVPA